MKPQVAPLGTRALCLRIECAGGAIIRVTRYPRDLIMSNGQVYQTGSGFDFTGYAAGSSFSPSAIDLDGILGFAELLKSELTEPEQQEYAEIIHRSGEHLLNLVTEILDLTKIESGEMTFIWTDIPLKQVVEETAAVHRGASEAKGLTFEL